MPFQTVYHAQAIPPWLDAIYRAMAERSQQLGQAEYPRYRGEVIAPFAPETQEAIRLAGEREKYLPYFQEARRQYAAAGQKFPEHYQEYMNPYTEQVVENIARLGGRTLKENILPQLQSQFIGLGQERSMQHDEQRARAVRDLQEAILREQQKALAHGYEHAGDLFHKEKLRQLETGRAGTEQGRYAQAAHTADVEALQQAGALKQQQAQNILNEQRGEFLRQAYYPHQMLQQHMGVMQGVPQQGISTQGLYTPAQNIPQVNVAGQLGGLAAQLYGAGQGQRRKTGGSVHKKQKPFGLSELKFKSHNEPQKHQALKHKSMKRGF